MTDTISLSTTVCPAGDPAGQLFLVPPVSYISVESPLKVETIDPPFYENGNLLISIFAVLISIYSFKASKDQVREARDESVNDLFWFREVVYPRSIVPLLDLLDSFSNYIPAPIIAKSSRKAASKKCYALWNTQNSSITYKLAYLAQWNAEIYMNITGKLELVEDSIAYYCYLLESKSSDPINEHRDCLSAISDLQAYLFNNIKQAHLGARDSWQPIKWLKSLFM